MSTAMTPSVVSGAGTAVRVDSCLRSARRRTTGRRQLRGFRRIHHIAARSHQYAASGLLCTQRHRLKWRRLHQNRVASNHSRRSPRHPRHRRALAGRPSRRRRTRDPAHHCISPRRPWFRIYPADQFFRRGSHDSRLPALECTANGAHLTSSRWRDLPARRRHFHRRRHRGPRRLGPEGRILCK